MIYSAIRGRLNIMTIDILRRPSYHRGSHCGTVRQKPLFQVRPTLCCRLEHAQRGEALHPNECPLWLASAVLLTSVAAATAATFHAQLSLSRDQASMPLWCCTSMALMEPTPTTDSDASHRPINQNDSTTKIESVLSTMLAVMKDKTVMNKADSTTKIESMLSTMLAVMRDKTDMNVDVEATFDRSYRQLEDICTSLFKIWNSNGDALDVRWLDELVVQMRDWLVGNRSLGDGDDSSQGMGESETQWFQAINWFLQYNDEIESIAQHHLEKIDLSRLTLSALLYYYLDHQDDETPKRWNQPLRGSVGGEIDCREIAALKEAITWAQLSDSDTADEIKKAISSMNALSGAQYALLSCDLQSSPKQPAHFVAFQQSRSSQAAETHSQSLSNHDPNSLSVVVVIRGTKSLADLYTDVLCHETPVEYEHCSGLAHASILDSGRYIVEKYHDQLLALCRQYGKQQVELTIIGHSLGAGTAVAAGMEWNSRLDPLIRVANVFGFGCPPMLSKELAEKCTFVTTVINDGDIVPCLSGSATTNLLLDILEYDWVPSATQDVNSVVDELKIQQPILFQGKMADKITEKVGSLIHSVGYRTILESHQCREPVVLFPPGKCIQLYRTGSTVRAYHVPNSEYSKINVSRRMLTGKDSLGRVCVPFAAHRTHNNDSLALDHFLKSGYLPALNDITHSQSA